MFCVTRAKRLCPHSMSIVFPCLVSESRDHRRHDIARDLLRDSLTISQAAILNSGCGNTFSHTHTHTHREREGGEGEGRECTLTNVFRH